MATKEFFKKNKKLVIAVTGIVVTLLFLIILFLSLFNIDINLNGSPKETIEYGDTYTEQGATAAFNTPASKFFLSDRSIPVFSAFRICRILSKGISGSVYLLTSSDISNPLRISSI